MLKALTNGIASLIFPPFCLSCERKIREGALCSECFARIPLHATLFCGRCRSRLPQGSKICHRDTPYLLAAASEYSDETVRKLIHGLKFNGVRLAAVPLAGLMTHYFASLRMPFEDYVVVPVPLGRKRKRERGFNQAELLAERIAKRLSLPLYLHALVRIRNTPAQTELADLNARRMNVAECFSVPTPEDIVGKNVLLVDDVATSGATLTEAARALKRAGAKKIVAIVAAKA